MDILCSQCMRVPGQGRKSRIVPSKARKSRQQIVRGLHLCDARSDGSLQTLVLSGQRAPDMDRLSAGVAAQPGWINQLAAYFAGSSVKTAPAKTWACCCGTSLSRSFADPFLSRCFFIRLGNPEMLGRWFRTLPITELLRGFHALVANPRIIAKQMRNFAQRALAERTNPTDVVHATIPEMVPL